MENVITCDAYFEPRYVWEVKAADLSLSPMHSAGMGETDPNEEDKGVALRFNRRVRDRPDKKPEEATSTSQIIEMYQKQATVMAQNATVDFGGEVDDDEFDL